MCFHKYVEKIYNLNSINLLGAGYSYVNSNLTVFLFAGIQMVTVIIAEQLIVWIQIPDWSNIELAKKWNGYRQPL